VLAGHLFSYLLTNLQNICDYVHYFFHELELTSRTSIHHAELTVIFATKEHIPTLLKLAPKTPLELIVCIDNLSNELKKILTSWADVQKVKLLELRESMIVIVHDIYFWLTSRKVEQIGKENPVEPFPAVMEQIASICYTSVSVLIINSPYIPDL
jgi:hypothetical protein